LCLIEARRERPAHHSENSVKPSGINAACQTPVKVTVGEEPFIHRAAGSDAQQTAQPASSPGGTKIRISAEWSGNGMRSGG
jgi:hypothetical protein